MRTLLLVALGLAALAPAQDPTPAPSVDVRTLAAGTPWATDALVLDSGIDGPTVVVVGGMHGDEPAGFRAARQIADWSPARGRLCVVPRANARGVAAGTRDTPDLPDAAADLNRAFPSDTDPDGELAAALWQLVAGLRPALVVDLHEGAGLAAKDPRAVGQSVLHGDGAAAAELATAACAALNATIDDADRHFVAKAALPAGSLARAVGDRLGVPALLIVGHEDGKLAARTRALRLATHAALARLGVVEHGPHVVLDRSGADLCKVALFDDAGAGGRGPGRLEALLVADHGFVVRRVCAADVRDGALAAFDVAIFPGGSGSGQGNALGATGREVVRRFVGDGGGYVGICAGAYLAANNYTWSLRILDADVIDRAHWKRGRGPVAVEWSDAARAVAPAPAQGDVLYVNGPLYAPSGDAALPDFEVLGWFRGEIRQNDAPVGVMRDSPAVVRGAFGAGRVVCSSPHPEQTDGLDEVVRALVRAAAGR